MIQRRPRKNGTVAYYVSVDYPAQPGQRRRRRNGTFDSLKAARGAERAWQQEAASGGVPPSRQTLGAYLTAWLAEKAAQVGETSHEHYTVLVRSLILPHLGEERLDRLTPTRLQTYVNDLRANGRKGGGPLSSSRVNAAYSVLHQAFGRAHELGLLAANPMTRVRPVRRETKDYPEWTDAHLTAFLHVAASSPLGPYWALALVTGMRRGELLGLKWRDVDFERGYLHLRQQIKVAHHQVREGSLKSKKPRMIALGPAMLGRLAAHQAAQAEARAAVFSDWEEHDLVFCAPNGCPWYPSSINHMFERLIQQAGLPRIKPHLLRALNAGISVAEGADPRTLADRLGHAHPSTTADHLGHAHPSTTADHYLRASTSRQRALAAAVEDAILGAPPGDQPEAPGCPLRDDGMPAGDPSPSRSCPTPAPKYDKHPIAKTKEWRLMLGSGPHSPHADPTAPPLWYR